MEASSLLVACVTSDGEDECLLSLPPQLRVLVSAQPEET